MRPELNFVFHRNDSFTAQRWLSLSATAIAALLSIAVLWWLSVRYGRPDFFSGYSLLGTCLLLVLLSARKRLLAIPLGSVNIWLQIHVYTGILSLVLFVCHVGMLNGGWLESLLATSFLWVALSGLYLWYLSRSSPKKLLAMGRDVIFEEIPRLQRVYGDEAYKLALQSTQLGEGVSLADYYHRELIGYFHSPRGLWFGLFPTLRKRRRILRELDSLDRYLGADGRAVRDQICDLVRKKDELDFHWAIQNRMRLWTTLHLSGLWGLGLLIAVHVVSVLAFAQRG
jgi:hypothetical protein